MLYLSSLLWLSWENMNSHSCLIHGMDLTCTFKDFEKEIEEEEREQYGFLGKRLWLLARVLGNPRRTGQGKVSPPPPPVLLNIHKCGVRLCWLETRLSGCSIVHVTDSPGKSLLSCETCKFKKIEFHSEKMWFYYFFLKLLDWIQLSPLPVLLLLLLLFSVCGGVCCIFW